VIATIKPQFTVSHLWKPRSRQILRQLVDILHHRVEDEVDAKYHKSEDDGS
jgi:hypothetical protein